MRIIASDYDGTLNYGGIDDEKREAVRAWQAQGNLFVLVTGRDKSFCPEMQEKSGIATDYFLACNGAVILDGSGRMADESRCEGAVIGELLAFLFGCGCAWANVCTDRLLRIYNKQHKDCPAGAEGMEAAAGIAYFNQVSTVLPSFEEAAAVTRAIGEKFGDAVNALQNGVCIDIVPAGMDKAQGIYRLLSLCGAKAEDVIAVGDNVNDAAMIGEFYSYAMENGVEQIKKLADAVTPGITQLIRRELERG